MAIYCIDDGGDGTQTNTTQSASTLDWSKADTSVDNLLAYDANALTTHGNIIYFGDDHNDPNVVANKTYTTIANAGAVAFISADRTLSTPTRKQGTGAQLSSLGGAYHLVVDGNIAFYGMRLASGGNITLTVANTESGYLEDTTFALGVNSTLCLGSYPRIVMVNPVIDLTADGTTNRTNTVILGNGALSELVNATFINPGYRTGMVCAPDGLGEHYITGGDFSGFPSSCELVGLAGRCHINNAKVNTAAPLFQFPTNATRANLTASNVTSGADLPEAMTRKYVGGLVVASNAIYRSGGAAVEGTPVAWLMTTDNDDTVNAFAPLSLPWIGGLVTAGSRTFDVYVTNDTGDFYNDEVWIELEYANVADDSRWVRASSRVSVVGTRALQADDTSSSWIGTGPSFTYKQKLSLSVTVGEAGQYRLRVCVGLKNITGSRYFYIDPKVTVT